MIVDVDRKDVARAGEIHARSWQESHRAFCAPEFVAMHTPERQAWYLREKMEKGSRVYMLLADGVPMGVVSVTGSLIEDLYVLPEGQNRGYGTALLRHAIAQCAGTPTLWILENNHRAARLYRRMGFCETGRSNAITESLNEIELALDEAFGR